MFVVADFSNERICCLNERFFKCFSIFAPSEGRDGSFAAALFNLVEISNNIYLR